MPGSWLLGFDQLLHAVRSGANSETLNGVAELARPETSAQVLGADWSVAMDSCRLTDQGAVVIYEDYEADLEQRWQQVALRVEQVSDRQVLHVSQRRRVDANVLASGWEYNEIPTAPGSRHVQSSLRFVVEENTLRLLDGSAEIARLALPAPVAGLDIPSTQHHPLSVKNVHCTSVRGLLACGFNTDRTVSVLADTEGYFISPLALSPDGTKVLIARTSTLPESILQRVAILDTRSHEVLFEAPYGEHVCADIDWAAGRLLVGDGSFVGVYQIPRGSDADILRQLQDYAAAAAPRPLPVGR